MPFDRTLYPADWERIAVAVKDRAGWRCEWPGCGAEHQARLHRDDLDLERFIVCTAGPCCRQLRPAITVILTAAHRCDCRPICGNLDHLSALCQLHHLRLDARQHGVKARATRAANRKAKLAAAAAHWNAVSEALYCPREPTDGATGLFSH
jgi:hypothetical protein